MHIVLRTNDCVARLGKFMDIFGAITPIAVENSECELPERYTIKSIGFDKMTTLSISGAMNILRL